MAHTVNLPDHLYARVVALGRNVDEFCSLAVGRALKDIEMAQKPAPKNVGGRPLKGDRVNVTVYLERRFVLALDALATSRGTSRADAINSILENAVKTGALPEPTDG